MESTEPNWEDFGDSLKMSDMAKVLGVSIGTVKNRETAGLELPPTIPGGGGQRVWRKDTVKNWYKSLEA